MAWWVCSESFRRLHYIIVADSSQLILALPCAHHLSNAKLFASGSITIGLLILSLSFQVTGCSHNSLGLIKSDGAHEEESSTFPRSNRFIYPGEWPLTPNLFLLLWINRHLLMVDIWWPCGYTTSLSSGQPSSCIGFLLHGAPLAPCQKLPVCLRHFSVSVSPSCRERVEEYWVWKNPSSVYWWVCFWIYFTKRTWAEVTFVLWQYSDIVLRLTGIITLSNSLYLIISSNTKCAWGDHESLCPSVSDLLCSVFPLWEVLDNTTQLTG